MIIDGNTVETGSYNYTASAQTKNAENYQIYHNYNQTLAITLSTRLASYF